MSRSRTPCYRGRRPGWSCQYLLVKPVSYAHFEVRDLCDEQHILLHAEMAAWNLLVVSRAEAAPGPKGAWLLVDSAIVAALRSWKYSEDGVNSLRAGAYETTCAGRNVSSSTVVECRSRVMCYFWTEGVRGMSAVSQPASLPCPCQRPIRGTSQGSLCLPGSCRRAKLLVAGSRPAVAHHTSPPQITPNSSADCAAIHHSRASRLLSWR